MRDNEQSRPFHDQREHALRELHDISKNFVSSICESETTVKSHRSAINWLNGKTYSVRAVAQQPKAKCTAVMHKKCSSSLQHKLEGEIESFGMKSLEMPSQGRELAVLTDEQGVIASQELKQFFQWHWRKYCEKYPQKRLTDCLPSYSEAETIIF